MRLGRVTGKFVEMYLNLIIHTYVLIYLKVPRDKIHVIRDLFNSTYSSGVTQNKIDSTRVVVELGS